VTMDSDDVLISNDEADGSRDESGESWLAEQARLVLLEDGS
jgi:hypothetical protein